jgi:hypothetical protein
MRLTCAFSLLFRLRLTRRLSRERDEQRRHSTSRAGPPGVTATQPKSVRRRPPLPVPLLPPDVDSRCSPVGPRARGVTDLAVLARRMTDDLGQERLVVPVVVHLAKIGRENASGLVPDLAGRRRSRAWLVPMRKISCGRSRALIRSRSTSTRKTRRLRRTAIASAPRAPCRGSREIDTFREDAAVDEQLAVVEIGSLHDQPGVSLGCSAASRIFGQSRYPRESSPP